MICSPCRRRGHLAKDCLYPASCPCRHRPPLRVAGLATLAAASLAAVTGCAASTQPPGPSTSSVAPSTATATVTGRPTTIVRVVDGDTIVVTDDVRQTTIRELAFDTPETVAPGKPVQCGGPEATRRARELEPVGAQVILTQDPTQDDKDRYGRELRYVEVVGRTKDVGLQLVVEGHARAYKLASGPAPQRYADYQAAQTAAQAAKTGMWGTCP